MKRPPLDLDAITIASPCTVPWDSMSGDERRRFCGQCRLHVHDISQLTRREAVELLERTEGNVCLRVWRRPDGRVVTRDCGRVRRALERRILWLRTTAATVLGALGLAGCRSACVTAPVTEPVSQVPATLDASRPTMGSPPMPPPPPVIGKTAPRPVPRPAGATETIGR